MRGQRRRLGYDRDGAAAVVNPCTTAGFNAIAVHGAIRQYECTRVVNAAAANSTAIGAHRAVKQRESPTVRDAAAEVDKRAARDCQI